MEHRLGRRIPGRIHNRMRNQRARCMATNHHHGAQRGHHGQPAGMDDRVAFGAHGTGSQIVRLCIGAAPRDGRIEGALHVLKHVPVERLFPCSSCIHRRMCDTLHVVPGPHSWTHEYGQLYRDVIGAGVVAQPVWSRLLTHVAGDSLGIQGALYPPPSFVRLLALLALRGWDTEAHPWIEHATLACVWLLRQLPSNAHSVTLAVDLLDVTTTAEYAPTDPSTDATDVQPTDAEMQVAEYVLREAIVRRALLLADEPDRPCDCPPHVARPVHTPELDDL